MEENCKHDILTWGIGSTGPRCIWWPEEIVEDLASINCIDCLRHMVAYERKQFQIYRENHGDYGNQNYENDYL